MVPSLLVMSVHSCSMKLAVLVLGRRDEATAVTEGVPTIEKQTRISNKKCDAVASAPAGQMPQFVGSRGETWQPEADAVPNIAQTIPVPAFKTGALGIFVAPGTIRPSNTILESMCASLRAHAHHADIVLVDSVYGQWDSPSALIARLLGLCLADVLWLQSRRQSGIAISFRPAVQERMVFYVSAAFKEQWPDHVKTLQLAERKAPKPMLDALSKGFRVLLGSRPNDAKGFSLLSTTELAALAVRKKHHIGLKDLIARVNFPQ